MYNFTYKSNTKVIAKTLNVMRMSNFINSLHVIFNILKCKNMHALNYLSFESFREQNLLFFCNSKLHL